MTSPMPPGAGGPCRAVRSLPALAGRLTLQWWPQVLALAAACGVVAATIAGALGVGDALQSGLRRLAVDRLGGIESAVVSDDFFRASLAEESASRSTSGDSPTGATGRSIIPAIVLEVTLEAGVGQSRRTARATLLACDETAGLGFSAAVGPVASGGAAATAINGVLAEDLGVGAGDGVVVRITKRSAVPADSPLGRRTAESAGRRLTISQVLPRAGLGQFSLRPTQVTGGLIVVPLATAQEILRRGEVANALFVASTGADRQPPATAADGSLEWLRRRLQPTLADLGLGLEPVAAGGALRLTSRRLILPADVDAAAGRLLAPQGGMPTLVFLANALATVSPPGETRPLATVPYSTVAGIDSMRLPVGELVDAFGATLALPGPEEIVIDRWMADDFAAQGRPVAEGDWLDLSTFLPETADGRVEEASCRLRISGIAAMRGAAVARELVPEVEGVTDTASIADWDPPFPFDRSRVRTTPPHDEDDRYWKNHGAAPKAFVSLECARRLAGSRFGATTAWFVPAERVGNATLLGAELAAAIPPEGMGWRLMPLRADALAAAQGSTPFGGLFLALSSFIVASGLLLEWLLFQLLVAAHRRDVGLLSALGWPAGRIAKVLCLVGLAAAVGGIVLGTLCGPLWAGVLLRTLAASWNAAVAAGSSQAFGDGATGWRALGIGAVASTLLSLAAIWWAARGAARQKPLRLLQGGQAADETSLLAGSLWRVAAVAAGGLAVGAGLAWWAGRTDAQTAVGLFFASGGALLAGFLGVVRLLLAGAGGRRPLRTLSALAWRGLAHAPARAFSVAAIVAVAEFLIVAVSAFSLAPPARPHEHASPTGGWTFIATFAEPTSVDPTDASTRNSLGLSDDAERALADCTFARLRASSGDDASCTNLYAAQQPTVLGLGPGFIQRGGFAFTSHAPLPALSGDQSPWQLLERVPAEGSGQTPIPAILDEATARWALKLGGVGARFQLPDGTGGTAELEIVGLLQPGILQGYVLVGERHFQRLFPRSSGYAMALVDAGAMAAGANFGKASADDAAQRRVAAALRAAWADAGVTVQPALDRLRSLAAVQNTFLAGFQALGTLGLLLGTAGVGAVQIQGVLERRRLFGLLQAVGFSRGRLALLVVLETLFMVGLGLAAGALAGAATLPAHAASGRVGLPLGWILLTCGLTLAVALLAGLAACRGVLSVEPRETLSDA